MSPKKDQYGLNTRKVTWGHSSMEYNKSKAVSKFWWYLVLACYKLAFNEQ